MIPAVPKFLPDEVLYGFNGRYFDLNNTRSFQQLSFELYSTKSLTASIEFPQRLKHLTENLRELYPIDVETLISKHTLFPFWNRFLTPDKSKFILDGIVNGENLFLKAVSGLNGAKFTSRKWPKYCPECIREDTIIHSQPYFHRAHQLPIPVCPSHDIKLFEVTLPIEKISGHSYVTLDNLSKVKMDVIQNNNELISAYSKKCLSLLTNEDFKLKVDGTFYFNSLNERGYYRGKTLDYSSLEKAVREIFNNSDIIPFIKATSNTEDLKRFLLGPIHRPGKILNPARHFLLHEIIESSARSHSQESFTGSIKKRILCYNKASDHYLKETISKITTTYDQTLKENIKVVECDCGMIYKIYSDKRSKTPSRRMKIKITEYGETWKEKLQSCILSGDSFYKISKTLGIGINVLKRFVDKQEYKSLEQIGKLEVQCHQYRILWEKALSESIQSSISMARKLLPKIYKWLYRHDREWLIETNNKYIKKPKHNQLKIDWNQLDEKLLTQAKQNTTEFLLRNHKRQITKAKLIRSLSTNRLITKANEWKFPKTISFIEASTESVSQFQRRKIKYVIGVFLSEEKPIKVSNILKVSGFRKVLPTTMDLIKKYTN